MNLVYEWPHFVNNLQIGVIKRFLIEEKGKQKKQDIPYYKKNGSQWEAGFPEEYNGIPLFGLDSYKSDIEPLIICEGQKAQTAWQGLGYQAVTPTAGCSIENAAWYSIQIARTIWLAPDNDITGEKKAETIWSIIKHYENMLIKVIRLPGLDKTDDIVDWLQQQPELKEWDGYDPLDDHPARSAIRERLDHTINAHLFDCPSHWVDQEEWPEPYDLETGISPVHKMPVELIPEPFKDWLLDNQQRMGAPLEYLAVSAIVTAAAIIGASITIRPKRYDSWSVVPNLYSCIAGPVSTMKSASLGAPMKMLEDIDDARFAEYKEKQEVYEREQFAYEQEITVAKQNTKSAARSKHESSKDVELPPPPTEPKLKRVVVYDATVPALTKILKENERGALLYQDELYGLFKTWDQEGRQSDRPFFLKAWNGNQSHIVDRSSKDMERIKNLCVSILGGMQPDTIKRYLIESGDSLNDGMIQRFQMLIYLTAGDIGDIDEQDKPENEKARFDAKVIYENLSSLNWTEKGAQVKKNEKPYFKFSADAQNLYDEWLKQLKIKVRGEEHQIIAQHLNKYRSLMPSLALIFHMIDIANYKTDGPVSVEAAQLAADWCEFLEEHARRVYSINQPYSVAQVLKLAEKIQEGKLGRSFKPWEVQTKSWKGLKKKSAIIEACVQLIELGWLRKLTTKSNKGGPAKVEFLVNPAVKINVETV